MRQFRAYWKFIIWSFMIIVLSGFPGKALTELFSWDRLFSFDKLAHAFIYFIQMLLLSQALIKAFPHKKPLHLAIISFLVTVFFGILMELLQAHVFSDRSGDVMDVLANSFGSVLALIYVLLVRKKQAIH